MSNRIFKGAEEISVILNRVTKLLKNTLAKEFSLNNVYYHKKTFPGPFRSIEDKGKAVILQHVQCFIYARNIYKCNVS